MNHIEKIKNKLEAFQSIKAEIKRQDDERRQATMEISHKEKIWEEAKIAVNEAIAAYQKLNSPDSNNMTSPAPADVEKARNNYHAATRKEAEALEGIETARMVRQALDRPNTYSGMVHRAEKELFETLYAAELADPETVKALQRVSRLVSLYRVIEPISLHAELGALMVSGESRPELGEFLLDISNRLPELPDTTADLDGYVEELLQRFDDNTNKNKE